MPAAIGGGINIVEGERSRQASEDIAERSSAASLAAGERSQEFTRERLALAQGLVDPYVQREVQTSNQLLYELGMAPYVEPEGQSRYPNIAPIEGGAYQQGPGYQQLQQAGSSAVSQGATNVGDLYGGARGEALSQVDPSIEGQFYTNYLNQLQNLASPQVSQNIGALAVGQGATVGAQGIAAQRLASDYNLQGTAATQAARADQIGALSQLASSYFSQNGA